jgi:DNA polymerase I-like protein with 3'-5' exonuclease and polymerase domains
MGSDILRLVMGELSHEFLKLEKEGIEIHPLLVCHDEIVVECDEEWAEFVRDLMIGVMRDCCRDRETGEWMLRVGLEASGKIGTRWEK